MKVKIRENRGVVIFDLKGRINGIFTGCALRIHFEEVITMKRVLVLLLVLVTEVAGAEITGRTYINDAYQFQVSLPGNLNGWTITDQEPGAALVIMAGPNGEVFSVVAEDLLEPVPLKDFVDLTVFLFSILFEDWEQESRTELKIDNVEAIEVVSTVQAEGIPVRLILWFMVKGNYAYSIQGVYLGDPFPFPFGEYRSIKNTFRFLPLTSAMSVEPGGKLLTTWAAMKRR